MALGCIEGRSDPIFRFPGMDYALSYPNISLIQSNLAADAYQIAQTKPLNIEIRYVSQKSAGSISQNRVREHLYEHFPAEVQIDFVRVEDIPYNQSGKQQRIVREFDL